MPAIEIEVAGDADRATIANLMQLYVHDFTDFWVGTDRAELQADGRFAPYPGLARYWDDADRQPLLIRSEGRLIGFALVDRHSHSGSELDRNVGEFFIARKYRRGGYGSAALAAIVARWPGRWEAAVTRKNLAALAFWRRAVAALPDARDVEEVDMVSAEWDGPVLRFTV